MTDDTTTHPRTLIALATSGALCEPCPLPWSCERCDEFFGPDTAHVWQLFDAEDNTLEYLSAEVDGPAFVAWVNAHGPVDLGTGKRSPS